MEAGSFLKREEEDQIQVAPPVNRNKSNKTYKYLE